MGIWKRRIRAGKLSLWQLKEHCKNVYFALKNLYVFLCTSNGVRGSFAAANVLSLSGELGRDTNTYVSGAGKRLRFISVLKEGNDSVLGSAPKGKSPNESVKFVDHLV